MNIVLAFYWASYTVSNLSAVVSKANIRNLDGFTQSERTGQGAWLREAGCYIVCVVPTGSVRKTISACQVLTAIYETKIL